jgi:hypothetical protein
MTPQSWRARAPTRGDEGAGTASASLSTSQTALETPFGRPPDRRQGAGLQTAMVSRSANAGPAAAPGILGRFRSGP